MIFSVLVVCSSLVTGSLALNDWKKPCTTTNECAWDLPAGAAASGSLKVWTSSSGAIGDITPAAGWHILDCDPKALNQSIRMVCTGDQDDCDHLHLNGASGTIVRLPNSCGAGPFAAVDRIWTHKDQSIPADVNAKLAKRANAVAPVVHGVAIHTDFAKVNPKNESTVHVKFLAFNVPGLDKGTDLTQDKGKVPGKVARKVATASDQLSSVGASIVKGFAPPSSTASKSSKLPVSEKSFFGGHGIGKFNKTISKTTHVDLNFNKQLANVPLTCGPAKVDVTMAVSSQNSGADVTVGVLAEGTILPPNLSEFEAFVGMNANIDAKLTLKADVTGSLDSGLVPILSVGIPGFDVPGIFSVGPTFAVNLQGKANLDVNVDLEVDLAYKVNQAQLFFPNSAKHPNTGSFNPADTPLKLSAAPSVASKLTMEAHVIPKIDIGMTAFGNIKADVFVQLDASATLGFDLTAGVTAGVTVGGPKNKTSTVAPKKGTPFINRLPVKPSATKGEGKEPTISRVPSAKFSQPAAKKPPTKAPAPKKGELTPPQKLVPPKSAPAKPVLTTRDGLTAEHELERRAAQLNGCVNLKGGFVVTGGANADFFSFVKKDFQKTFFQKNFQIFQKCLGTGLKRREYPAKMQTSELRRRLLQTRAFTCPLFTENTLLSIAQQTISNIPAI